MDVKPTRLKQIKSVAIVSSGNFLEMYDFMVFGYYAPAIAKSFFPTGNEFAGLMLTLMTFGAGFLMRPVGAVVLGAYVDKHGRRKGLMLTLALMAVGTLTIALMPTYQQIGLFAPLLILLGRLIQGLSAGVEVGGVSVYLAEIATPGRKGFYVAWQSASQQVAVVFAALIGFLLNQAMSPEDVTAWGWRIPFVIGCLMVPFLLVIRRFLEETPAFQQRTERPELHEVFKIVAANYSLVLRGMMIAVMTTVFFYMITAYTPTYGSKVLKLTAADGFLVTLCVGLTNFVMLPIMGAVSDRIGRRPLLIGAALVALVSGYPMMNWLVSDPSFGRLLAVQLFFAVVYASYNGAMIVFLTEIMPTHVRTAGFSLAYSLATAIFGGFTPAISTYLIHATNDRAIPGVWLSIAALVGLLAAVTFGSRRGARIAAT
ncbi:MFS transporter [Caulobacter sp.]|uniref:MFS transporter n=1 Tax=Caulobacter sp. TaxID=78 RepID=UPI002B47F0B5|nr:MFS transporter [Caulobacter sp.]HJV41497.1 MFS transporter [Caulobacter sp.]